MNPILNQNLFFVKEHVGMFKAANNFDIYNPENNQQIMTCREPNLGFFTKMLRFTDYKRMTPFNVEIRTLSGELVLRISRGVTLLRSSVEVFDDKDRKVGYFRQRLLSIGGKFEIYNNEDRLLCVLKGKWTSWDFQFIKDEKELAHVSKKWAGIGKEFFTSADNYMLEINQTVAPDDTVRQLILAAVMCIDMVLKE